jgi:hypothetical protein
MAAIQSAPQGQQTKEKGNLEQGKFDRAIPCPKGVHFFHYRDEDCVPMLDTEIGDLQGVEGVFAASDVIKLAKTNPEFAHNPTKKKDPFLHLQINLI